MHNFHLQSDCLACVCLEEAHLKAASDEWRETWYGLNVHMERNSKKTALIQYKTNPSAPSHWMQMLSGPATTLSPKMDEHRLSLLSLNLCLFYLILTCWVCPTGSIWFYSHLLAILVLNVPYLCLSVAVIVYVKINFHFHIEVPKRLIKANTESWANFLRFFFDNVPASST